MHPDWCRHHSAEAYWEETQKVLQRGQFRHDASIIMGYYADKVWAERIMERVKPGEDMDSCGGYVPVPHAASAMQLITNQDVGDEGDAWLEWWKANQSKSQEEWILDGFREYGLEIGTPVEEEGILGLLELLAKTSTDERGSLPFHAKYNAFRWLRDSGFDPLRFALSDSRSAVSEERRQGLLEYAKLERSYPKKDRVGILEFGKEPDPYADYREYLPRVMLPKGVAAAYSLMVVPTLLGACLIMLSMRKRHRDTGEDVDASQGRD